MDIIFINGHKRSGKDTLGHIFARDHGAAIHKAAEPLYKAIQETFSLSPMQWASLYVESKETPCEELWGLSPRQAMIWLSEEVIKPRFGEHFFGYQLAMRINTCGDDLIVVTDSGMIREVESCIENTPTYKHHLINIQRDGTNGKNDSRVIITPNDVAVDTHHVVENNGAAASLSDQVARIIKTIREEEV